MIEAIHELRNPLFSFLCVTKNGTHVFGFRHSLERGDRGAVIVEPGEQVRLAGTVESPLTPGRYVLTCWISREAETTAIATQMVGIGDFTVYGSTKSLGLVDVDVEVDAAIIEGEGDRS